MKLRLLNVGFGNVVVANRIVAIVSPGSAPIKRLKEDAKARGKLIDATYGRKTRAIVVTDSDHVILSAVNPETAVLRLRGRAVVDQAEDDIPSEEETTPQEGK